MIQNSVTVGILNSTPGTNGLIFQADCIGNPNEYALDANVYEVGCHLFERDIETQLLTVTWVMSGTVAAPAWKRVFSVGTTTAVSGAATLNAASGIVTSESLTTAAAGTYTLTLTNSAILPTSLVQVQPTLGSATTGIPGLLSVTPSAGSVVIVVSNNAATAALNGTLLIGFNVIN